VVNAGQSLRPGGAFEIPGLDPDYETFVKHQDQVLTVTYEDDSTNEVTVKAGSHLRIYRQYDNRGYASGEGPEIDEDNCSDDILELEAPVNAGETLYFEATIMVKGDPTKNIGVCVRTPTNPTGGFHVIGRSLTGGYQGMSFSADYFNNPAGVVRSGFDSEIESYATLRVRGTLGTGSVPGMLKFQLGPAREGVPLAYVFDWDDGAGETDPESKDQSMVTLTNPLQLWVEGPLFDGQLPMQLILNEDIAWAMTSNAPDHDTLSTWRSTDNGRTFTLVDTLSNTRAGYISFDVSGRVWRLVSDSSNDSHLYRSDSGLGDDWQLIETFANGLVAFGHRSNGTGGFFSSTLRGIATHPTDATIIAVGGLSDNDNRDDAGFFVSTDDGALFTSVTVPAMDFNDGGVEVMFTSDGTLLGTLSYDEDSLGPFIYHTVILRSTDYSSFTTTELDVTNPAHFATPQDWQARSALRMTQASIDGTIYGALFLDELTTEEVLTGDAYPYGVDGFDAGGFGGGDTSTVVFAAAVRVWQSTDDGVTWDEIETPFHISLDTFGYQGTPLGQQGTTQEGFDHADWVPGEPMGIHHDGTRLLIFFYPLEHETFPTYNQVVFLVIGDGDPDWVDLEEWEFAVNGKSYTAIWHTGGSITWDGDNPLDVPPPDMSTNLRGINLPDRGYWLYIAFVTTALNVLTEQVPVSVDQGTLWFDNDNAAEAPFNGRGLGRTRTYDGPGPGVFIDDLLELSETYLDADTGLEQSRNLPYEGLTGWLWSWDGSEWDNRQEELVSASGIGEPTMRPGGVGLGNS